MAKMRFSLSLFFTLSVQCMRFCARSQYLFILFASYIHTYMSFQQYHITTKYTKKQANTHRYIYYFERNIWCVCLFHCRINSTQTSWCNFMSAYFAILMVLHGMKLLYIITKEICLENYAGAFADCRHIFFLLLFFLCVIIYFMCSW